MQGIKINSTETDHTSILFGLFASKSVSDVDIASWNYFSLVTAIHIAVTDMNFVTRSPNCTLVRNSAMPTYFKNLAASLPSRLAAKKSAFTLAEVLITLGIIGVVAALTIPSVIINYQKKETVTKLKKVYTTLSNAAEMSIAENGDMKGWDWTLAQTDVDKFVETYYVPYLSVSEKKWPNENYRIYNLAGRLVISNYSQLISVILSNGQIIIFKVAHDTGYMWIFADINGTKGPNRVGKDVFVFDGRNHAQRDSNKYYIKFWGQSDLWGRANLIGNNITENTPNTGGYGCSKENKYGYYSGFYCGALIMLDGWKISDDYPW